MGRGFSRVLSRSGGKARLANPPFFVFYWRIALASLANPPY